MGIQYLPGSFTVPLYFPKSKRTTSSFGATVKQEHKPTPKQIVPKKQLKGLAQCCSTLSISSSLEENRVGIIMATIN